MLANAVMAKTDVPRNRSYFLKFEAWATAGLMRGNLACIDVHHRLLKMYGFTVRLKGEGEMDSVSVNKFRDNLKAYVERIASEHAPLKVTRRSGEDFVVMSADDWEREQETLYVLQNQSLMKQIARSFETHGSGKGYSPTPDEVDEITGF